MTNLLSQVQDLARKLEGSAALNIYLLHKLGGQISIDRAEMERVVPDFEFAHAVHGNTITIKLCSPLLDS